MSRRSRPDSPAPVAITAMRESLHQADFTHDTIARVLGPTAMSALSRGELVPAERATRGGSQVETLIRLFLLRQTVPMIQARAAIPFAQAWQLGLVEPIGGDVVGLVDLRPYTVDPETDTDTWWIVSDFGTEQQSGPLRDDHVLGVGGASITLAQLAPRASVGSALDIGTGCGIQALHLAQHARSVTATDINPRALRFAAINLGLNGVEAELFEGDLLAPVHGRVFDQIVSNPPFVVGAGDGRYAYRDSGLAGDAIGRALVKGIPAALAPNGTAQLLANWMHVRGEPWADRVGDWLRGMDCDAWVVQRDIQDPAEYVSLWLADAGETSGSVHRRRYETWLTWLEEHNVEAIGFGFIMIRKSGSVDPTIVIEEARQTLAPPLGAQVTGWFDRQEWLAGHSDHDVLDARLTLAEGVSLEQVAQRDPAGGWKVLGQVLRQETGFRWREDVDQLVATLSAGFDGTHTVRQLALVLGAAYDLIPGPAESPELVELMQATAVAVRHLVSRGFALPAADA